MLIKLTGT